MTVEQQNELCATLIPAYNPDQNLVKLVDELNQLQLTNILVVNDGSSSEHDHIFEQLKAFDCHVIKHENNKGKGAALKTGIEYLLRQNNLKGVVTADADGQHLPKDILKIVKEANNSSEDLILGTRSFADKEIPFRSRFGNKITKYVIRIETGFKLSDTQTGLRFIPVQYAEKLLNIPGDRYEFEMNMITNAKSHDVDIHEIPIETVYLNNNEASHFRPILDSIRIYFVFFKFILSSMVSFGIDLLMYSIFIFALEPFFHSKHVIIATVLARIISALFNYIVNRKIVFQSDTKKSLLKYAGLSIAQLSASASGVYLLYTLIGHGEIVIKILIDSFLFIVSYFVQKLLIFRRKVGASI